MLAEIGEALGPGARILRADRVRTGGVAGFFCRERFDVVVEEPEQHPAGTGDAGAAARPASILDLAARVDETERATVSTEGASFAQVLARIAAEAGQDRPAPAPCGPEPGGPETPDGGLPAAVPAGAPPVTAATAAPARARRTLAADDGPDALALTRLGLPPALLPSIPPGEPVLAALVGALERLPALPPAPEKPGSVLAVAGPVEEALGVARQLAAQLGLEPDDVVLAARHAPAGIAPWLRVATPRAARERALGWRRRDHPVVVAVDAAPRCLDGRWAQEVLRALEPVTTWGVVDAGRKVEDVAAWASAIGGVDVLALDGTASTTTPAAVLALGVPVGLVDRQRATPARWAALLLDRIAA